MNVKLRFRENTNTSKTVGEAYYIDVIESPYGSTPGDLLMGVHPVECFLKVILMAFR